MKWLFRGVGLAVLLACLVAGCGTPLPPAPPPTPVTRVSQIVQLSEAQIEAVQEGVRGKLIDPTSAIFGRMIAGRPITPPGLINVCGWVNAKNSYGGYTGEKPFLGGLTSERGASPVFVLTRLGGADPRTYAILETCSRMGLPLL